MTYTHMADVVEDDNWDEEQLEDVWDEEQELYGADEDEDDLWLEEEVEG
jgi:hypothetical protein